MLLPVACCILFPTFGSIILLMVASYVCYVIFKTLINIVSAIIVIPFVFLNYLLSYVDAWLNKYRAKCYHSGRFLMSIALELLTMCLNMCLFMPIKLLAICSKQINMHLNLPNCCDMIYNIFYIISYFEKEPICNKTEFYDQYRSYFEDPLPKSLFNSGFILAFASYILLYPLWLIKQIDLYAYDFLNSFIKTVDVNGHNELYSIYCIYDFEVKENQSRSLFTRCLGLNVPLSKQILHRCLQLQDRCLAIIDQSVSFIVNGINLILLPFKMINLYVFVTAIFFINIIYDDFFSTLLSFKYIQSPWLVIAVIPFIAFCLPSFLMLQLIGFERTDFRNLMFDYLSDFTIQNLRVFSLGLISSLIWPCADVLKIVIKVIFECVICGILMITNIFSAIFNSVYAMFNGVDPSYSDENFATDEELTILKDETYYLTPFLTPRQIEDNYKNDIIEENITLTHELMREKNKNARLSQNYDKLLASILQSPNKKPPGSP
jgi:hypothetical protein